MGSISVYRVLLCNLGPQHRSHIYAATLAPSLPCPQCAFQPFTSSTACRPLPRTFLQAHSS